MRVLELCVIVVIAGAPWIVGIAYYWHKRPRDGSVPPSFGEYLRQLMMFR
jgi:hypothetical protein